MSFFTKRYHPPGTPPGTLTEAPATEAAPLRIRLIDYCADEITIRDDVDASVCQTYLQRDSVTWVHVQGPPTEAALRELGESFQLHSLALEDVLNIGQRPKVEPFDDQLFIVMSLPLMEEELVEVHQASFFLSKSFLVSFCGGGFAPFQPVVNGCRTTAAGCARRGLIFCYTACSMW